jgi:methyl-accepting chemotaxis protein
MFFNNKVRESELNSLSEELRNLEERYAKIKQENSSLKQNLDQSKRENHSLQHTINDLEHKLKREIEKNSQIDPQELEKVQQQSNTFEFLFKAENEHLKNALLDIQKNISDSTSLSRDSLEVSKEIHRISSETSGELEEIVTNIASLHNGTTQINDTIVELDNKAAEIAKATSIINDIVMQINILSLNASVEAATAGEAGKGFAVVASEVKNLANKTAEAAKTIDKVIKSMQLSVKKTDSSFTEIRSTIEDISKSTETYNEHIGNMFKVSNSTFGSFDHITDRVFMALAKLDHVIWKVNTYLSVAHKDEAFAFVNHHNCRLGKWYYEGLGQKYFSNTQSYPRLETPHASVHNATKRVFSSIDKEHSKVKYDEALEAVLEMEKASTEVFEILDIILHERINS